MAILDERNEFADAVSVAAAAGTALIGDVIDLEASGLDLGTASDLWFVITIATEVITGGIAGTVKFQLASDAQAAIATDGTATVHWDSGTVATAAAGANDDRLNAGALFAKVKLPAALPEYERYLGVLCVTATTTTTAGAINAFLTHDFGYVKHYADGAH